MGHSKLKTTIQTLEALLDAQKFEAAWELGLELEQALEDNSDADVEGNATISLLSAEAGYQLGKHAEAETRARTCIEAFRPGILHQRFAQSKYLLGRVLMARGQANDAYGQLNEARCAFLRYGDEEQEWRCTNMLASVAYRQSRYNHAIELTKKVIERAQASGDTELAIKCRRNLARAYILVGDFKLALINMGGEQEAMEELPAPVQRCRWYLSVGLVQMLSRNIERADYHLRKVGSIARQYSLFLDLMNYHEYWGELQTISGQPDEALKHFRVVLDEEPKGNLDRDFFSQTLRRKAEALLELERYEEAEMCAEKARAIAAEIKEQVEEVFAVRVLGMIDERRGDSARAHERLHEARDRFEKLGAKYESALTDLIIGKSKSFDISERVGACAAARRDFREMGIPVLMAEASVTIEALLKSGIKGKKSKFFVAVDSKLREDVPGYYIATDPKSVSIVESVTPVIDTNLSILIQGETGTGKDVLAKFIHYNSSRGDKPFQNIHVTNFTETIVHSELFGHKKGAFTSAYADQKGLFESADGGTIFLNEIADMPLTLQSKLLKFLEEHEYRRLGEVDQTRKIDVRIIAATNQNLQQAVDSGKFREDLYFRLAHFTVNLPPLRERPGDIIPLAYYFLRKFGRPVTAMHEIQDSKLGKELMRRHWRGNVREMENFLRTVIAIRGSSDLDDLGDLARQMPKETLPGPTSIPTHLNPEGKELDMLLKRFDWNQRAVARHMKVTEAAVRQKMKKHGIDRPPWADS